MRLPAVLLSVLFLAAAAFFGPAEAHAKGGEGGDLILLKKATINTGAGALSLSSADINEGIAGDTGFYIVQFDGPVLQSWKDDLSALGVRFYSYIPNNAFVVKMKAKLVDYVLAHNHVKYVGPYKSDYKTDPDLDTLVPLNSGAAHAPMSGSYPTVQLKVKVFDGEKVAPVRDAITAMGGKADVLLDGNGLNQKYLWAEIEADHVGEVSAMPAVEWVESYGDRAPQNTTAATITGADTLHDLWFPLRGRNQVLGIMDTGLDTGNMSTLHDDFARTADNGRSTIKGALSYRSDGSWSDINGHGTHVAGTMVGPDGIAPGAQLFVQSSKTYTVFGEHPPLSTEVFFDAVRAKVGIHNNSWATLDANTEGAVVSKYNTDSVELDTFVWEHPGFLPVVAAGNEAIDLLGNFFNNVSGFVNVSSYTPVNHYTSVTRYANVTGFSNVSGFPNLSAFQVFSGFQVYSGFFNISGFIAEDKTKSDGLVDLRSITAPGTAKNALTVGASESTNGGGSPYGYWVFDHITSFPVGDISSDLPADDEDGMYAFSGRGPTPDGRIKPDVVAPGTMLLSTLSQAKPPYATNSYAYTSGLAGTSSAAAVASGSAALVREYLTTFGGVKGNIPAALIKAFLINGAYYMPGQYGGYDYFTQPDMHQGFGRIDLPYTLYPGGTRYVTFVNSTKDGPMTGTGRSYTFWIENTGEPVIVTLVWSDYPSSASASKNLVNDLDLTVYPPDGAGVYKGNRNAETSFNAPWDDDDSTYDHTNNVEEVYFYTSLPGPMVVNIQGTNVPQGKRGQPFALVVSGGLGGFNPDPLSNGYYSISGTVINALTKAVEPGATVTASGPVISQATADGSGNFTIDWLMPGKYYITAEGTGGETTVKPARKGIKSKSVTGLKIKVQ